MANRLKDILHRPDERVPDDYYVVHTHYERFFVTRTAADRILRDLDAPVLPRWIRFVDLHGSRISLRSKWILYVCESTADQRTNWRKFDRARDLEEKADRLPGDDDD
jgi:hypothetical protein